MNEHLSAQTVERYHRRALSPAELLDADDHLADCEMCRQLLADEPRERAAANSLRDDLAAAEMSHLDYELLAAYVEGELDEIDREIADGHLKLCARCDEELSELRAFAAQMAAYPVKEYAPTPSPSLGEKALSFVKGWREGVRAFWRSNAFALPVQLASLGLTIALLLWVASLKSQNSQLQAALDQQRQESEKLRQDYQAVNASVAELQSQLAQLKFPAPSASPLVMTLNDGGKQVTWDKDGNVAGVSPAYQPTVKQTLMAGRLETPQMLSELMGRSSKLMGPADEGHPFALLAPVGVIVMNDRPTFRWRTLKGADSYVVRIYDADFNEVAASPRLSETSWAVKRSLERGRTYSWQVTARVGAKEIISPVKPAPEARFMVLDEAKAHELGKAKSESAGSHLTLGVLYTQFGLLDEAEQEFQILMRDNPQSQLIAKLLRSVRGKRRK